VVTPSLVSALKEQSGQKELLSALKACVASARPHPMQNPSMYRAWTDAAKVIAKHTVDDDDDCREAQDNTPSRGPFTS
jgi:hypothetical protein